MQNLFHKIPKCKYKVFVSILTKTFYSHIFCSCNWGEKVFWDDLGRNCSLKFMWNRRQRYLVSENKKKSFSNTFLNKRHVSLRIISGRLIFSYLKELVILVTIRYHLFESFYIVFVQSYAKIFNRAWLIK